MVVFVAGGIWYWQAYRVRDSWLQAEAALNRHDLSSAAAHLNRYLEQQPRDAAAWFLAGRTARRLGRHSEAEDYLKRCQELGGVTDATRLEWDLLRVQQGDLGDVHMRLRRTIAPDHPDAALVLEALARGYLKCDRLRDVMEACDLWVACQPDHPWPWLWRGGVYERLGNFHEALSDYRKALEHAPEDRDALLALAMLFVRARQPGPASEHLEHLLERNPDDDEALLGLAACRIEEGRPKDAVPLLERVLAKDPAPARGLFLRGKSALELRDPAGAERWLVRAVREAPDDAEALYQLILALRAQGKETEADRLAPRLEALRKDVARLDELVRIVARNPDDAGPRHEAGVVAFRLGRPDEGVRWLQSALGARGDHRATHAVLAEHFLRMGDPRADYHQRLAQTP
ncbi:MAG: tetratricopeptide repeat protein [Gemmataceae bacterium]|nr:tetratricopeptide repeat protein [Gemmataceae bacterium]